MSVLAEVIAILEAVPYLNVHDGHVTDSDGDTKTVSAPLPYVVLQGRVTEPVEPSLTGVSTTRIAGFDVRFTGRDRTQAEWAADKARTALRDARLTSVAGAPIVRWLETIEPADDPTWNRPDGGPLFVGTERFQLVY